MVLRGRSSELDMLYLGTWGAGSKRVVIQTFLTFTRHVIGYSIVGVGQLDSL